MRTTCLAVVLLTTASLTACGYSTTDRALSGGAIGAGVGAAGAAIADTNPLAGAAIGGAVGAAAGALTNPDTIDLGEPFWRRHR